MVTQHPVRFHLVPHCKGLSHLDDLANVFNEQKREQQEKGYTLMAGQQEKVDRVGKQGMQVTPRGNGEMQRVDYTHT